MCSPPIADEELILFVLATQRFLNTPSTDLRRLPDCARTNLNKSRVKIQARLQSGWIDSAATEIDYTQG